jgi:arsenical-resistance protein 2
LVYKASVDGVYSIGSSRGRGTRAAGWFDDYIRDQGNSTMTSCILVEGINGWAQAGEEYVRLMDDYQEEHWRK